MKKISLFLLLIAFVFNSSAQSRIIEIIDSLKHALAIAKEDTTKVNVLVQLAFFDGSYQHGLQSAQDGLALAKKIKYEKGEADCLCKRPYFSVSLKLDFLSSLFCFSNILSTKRLPSICG